MSLTARAQLVEHMTMNQVECIFIDPVSRLLIWSWLKIWHFRLKSRGIAVGSTVKPRANRCRFHERNPIPSLRSTEEAVTDMIENIEEIDLDNTAAYLNYNGKTIEAGKAI